MELSLKQFFRLVERAAINKVVAVRKSRSDLYSAEGVMSLFDGKGNDLMTLPKDLIKTLR